MYKKSVNMTPNNHMRSVCEVSYVGEDMPQQSEDAHLETAGQRNRDKKPYLINHFQQVSFLYLYKVLLTNFQSRDVIFPNCVQNVSLK